MKEFVKTLMKKRRIQKIFPASFAFYLIIIIIIQEAQMLVNTQSHAFTQKFNKPPFCIKPAHQLPIMRLTQRPKPFIIGSDSGDLQRSL